MGLERGHMERPPVLFLLTLLYDLALDVPSVHLASCRSLQPAIRALLYHTGQQLLFSLGRTPYTILGLVIAAQYRPLAFTSSQVAAPNALRGIPTQLLAKQAAQELGYDAAAAKLSEALHGFESSTELLTKLMHQCLHWIRLSIAHETFSNQAVDKVFQFRPADPSAFECAEALGTAALLGRMPVEILLPYSTTCGYLHMLTVLSELSEKWKDLNQLGEAINSHKMYTEREQKSVELSLEAQNCAFDRSNAIMHLAQADGHMFHNGVKGCALFFAGGLPSFDVPV
jgi:hypothetical protein